MVIGLNIFTELNRAIVPEGMAHYLGKKKKKTHNQSSMLSCQKKHTINSSTPATKIYFLKKQYFKKYCSIFSWNRISLSTDSQSDVFRSNFQIDVFLGVPQQINIKLPNHKVSWDLMKVVVYLEGLHETLS